MGDELKACPFCGGQPDRGFSSASVPGMDDCGFFFIECCDVHCHSEIEEEGVAAWNTRHQPNGGAGAFQQQAKDALEIAEVAIEQSKRNERIATLAGAEDAREQAWRNAVRQFEYNRWRSRPEGFSVAECDKRAKDFVDMMLRHVDAMSDRNKGKV